MPLPYAPLIPSPPYESTMKLGWRVGANPAIPLATPVDWSLAATGERSWSFHLLSLDLIDPLLVQYSQTGDVAALELAIQIGLDFWRTRDTRDEEADWYDMATGLRAWRLTYALEAAREEKMPIGRRRLLHQCVTEHEKRLRPDETFTAGSNHGFFQAAGQMAIGDSIFRTDPETRSVALSRLQMILETHFSSEGVHKEHSPDYHYFLHRGFEALRVRGLMPGRAAARRLDQIARTLTWFLTPEGRVANFGDSDNRKLKVEEARILPTPTAGAKVFPEAGYAILRAGRGPRAGYLAQTLGYHSRVHKQADDLSVIWSARGKKVLIDAGRLRYGKRPDKGSALEKRGYRYADPRRVFCEGASAHNIPEIEGSRDARQSAPYGSALLASAEHDGLLATLGRVSRKPHQHTRLMIGDGLNWLVLIDGFFGAVLPPKTRQWLHLGPEWTLSADGAGFRAVSDQDVVRIDPLNAGEAVGPHLAVQPDYQGWWSPRANVFEPAPAVAFARRGRLAAVSLAFADFGPTMASMDLDGRLEGSVTLTLGDGRRVAVRLEGGRLELDVKGTQA
ncbi:hypothetical protein ASG17_02410 [Brevundimonas sp. Leaf363]|nr:hypothetical protein ASG17_02410 [Brevundimonas sp. Leaf363]